MIGRRKGRDGAASRSSTSYDGGNVSNHQVSQSDFPVQSNTSQRRCKTTAVNWNRVDWSKTNTEIGKETGCKVSYVSRKRCEIAPDTRHHFHYRKETWQRIDWQGMTNSEIARITGKSKSVVSKWRCDFAPDTAKPKTRRRWCEYQQCYCLMNRFYNPLRCRDEYRHCPHPVPEELISEHRRQRQKYLQSQDTQL